MEFKIVLYPVNPQERTTFLNRVNLNSYKQILVQNSWLYYVNIVSESPVSIFRLKCDKMVGNSPVLLLYFVIIELSLSNVNNKKQNINRWTTLSSWIYLISI